MMKLRQDAKNDVYAFAIYMTLVRTLESGDKRIEFLRDMEPTQEQLMKLALLLATMMEYQLEELNE